LACLDTFGAAISLGKMKPSGESRGEGSMATLKLYGERARCWWCGKRIEVTPSQITVGIGDTTYEATVCSEEHGHAMRDAYREMEKAFRIFPWGMGIGLLLLIGSNFVSPPTWLVAAGFFALGVTMLACPFGTPQTVKSIGMRNSILVVRLLGIAVVTVALVFLWRLLI
jgi:hypothetical protein